MNIYKNNITLIGHCITCSQTGEDRESCLKPQNNHTSKPCDLNNDNFCYVRVMPSK